MFYGGMQRVEDLRVQRCSSEKMAEARWMVYLTLSVVITIREYHCISSSLPPFLSLIVWSARVAQAPFSRAWLKRLSSPPHRFDLLRLSVGIGLEASLLRGDCLKGPLTDWAIEGKAREQRYNSYRYLPQHTHTQMHTNTPVVYVWGLAGTCLSQFLVASFSPVNRMDLSL